MSFLGMWVMSSGFSPRGPTLAHRILSSIEPEPTAEVEAAWEVEIGERIRRYDAGETRSIPAAEVFANLAERLDKLGRMKDE
jgi:hypothetical protein